MPISRQAGKDFGLDAARDEGVFDLQVDDRKHGRSAGPAEPSWRVIMPVSLWLSSSSRSNVPPDLGNRVIEAERIAGSASPHPTLPPVGPVGGAFLGYAIDSEESMPRTSIGGAPAVVHEGLTRLKRFVYRRQWMHKPPTSATTCSGRSGANR